MCRIHCVKLVQELSGVYVSDQLDKLRLSGGNEMLAIAVLNTNIPLVPDIVRPVFSACRPLDCALPLNGSQPKSQEKLWMNCYFRIVCLLALCRFILLLNLVWQRQCLKSLGSITLGFWMWLIFKFRCKRSSPGVDYNVMLFGLLLFFNEV